jgi:hypothetical protein
MGLSVAARWDDVDVARVPMSTVTPGILRDVLGMSGGDEDLEVDDPGEEKTGDPTGDEGAEPPETGRDSGGHE